MILNNLNKQEDKSALSYSLTYRMYIAPMSSVDIANFPKAVNATISSNPLLPGMTFKYLDTLTNTINPNVEPGEIPANGKIILTPSIEGISKETLAYAYANAGKDFITVYERCADKQRFIAGDPCSGGLKFTYTSIGKLENGNAGIATKFEGGECPEPLWFYDGPLPLEDPEAIAADAATFALTSKPQYQLGLNTKATILTDITGVTDAHVGRVIEILGSATANPTRITSSATFVLKNGLEFVGSAGSRISFYINKTGTSTYTFHEVYRA